MIITRTTWAQVPDDTLVASPATGRVMIMRRKVTMPGGGAGVELHDPEDSNTDGARIVPVDPNAPIDTITSDASTERAVDLLSRSFALVRM